jgi:feruloyl esterase
MKLRSSAILLAMVLPGSTSAIAASCESLALLTIPDSTITMAQPVAAGAFTLPGDRGKANDSRFRDLPAFCRVAATLKPTSDSDIKVEVWLPGSGWNGKFQVVGNGGWGGAISYAALAEEVQRGYAAAATDTGHSGPTGEFVIGHPEKLVDYGYRSEHETTVKGKAILQAFYGRGPKLSYWNGCSTGGRQGLKEAQAYPNDFDGIIAGDPTNPRPLIATWELWVAQATLKDPASFIPASKFPMIHKAVLDACDATDGLKDGLIDDPTRCHFDPKVLECKDADGPTCLTTPQVEAARKIITPLKNPRTGKEITPPLALGTELGWKLLAIEPAASAIEQYRYVAFKNPDWDWKTLNFDSDVDRAMETDKGILTATDPNLKPFFGHGGKLLMYHGWSDQRVPPLLTINYYNKVVDTLGGEDKTKDSLRLFMVPGMAHCGGGEGPNTFDTVTALDRWVEKGQAPTQIIASHSTNGVVDRTRPLCPYPQIAKYQGSGSIDEASNFACKAP